MIYLLDTNVISELRRIRNGRGDRNVETWANGVRAEDLFLSAITVEELEIGVLLIESRDTSQGALLRKGSIAISYLRFRAGFYRSIRR